MTNQSIEVRRAVLNDAAALADLGAETFRDTYEQLFRPDDLEPRIEHKYGLRQQTDELQDDTTTLYIAFFDSAPMGFAKLNVGAPPVCVSWRHALQLERLYVRREVFGKGVGAALLSTAIGEAYNKGFPGVWLGVMEGNERATAFYRKHRFRQVGREPFAISQHQYFDLILERAIATPGTDSEQGSEKVVRRGF